MHIGRQRSRPPADRGVLGSRDQRRPAIRALFNFPLDDRGIVLFENVVEVGSNVARGQIRK